MSFPRIPGKSFRHSRQVAFYAARRTAWSAIAAHLDFEATKMADRDAAGTWRALADELRDRVKKEREMYE